MNRHWNTVVAAGARERALANGVHSSVFNAAVREFHKLGFLRSLARRRDVTPIVCTNNRLFRHTPRVVFHYRSIFAVVRKSRKDGTRGDYVLLTVLRRNADTYDPDDLRDLITDVITEAKAARELQVA